MRNLVDGTKKKQKKKNADSIAVPDHHAARALLETESECERREGQQWKKKKMMVSFE